MVGRADCPPRHTGLPRAGAVVWVVWGGVAGIRWPQGRPLTTETHAVPQLGRLLLATLVAAVLLTAEAAAVSRLKWRVIIGQYWSRDTNTVLSLDREKTLVC